MKNVPKNIKLQRMADRISALYVSGLGLNMIVTCTR